MREAEVRIDAMEAATGESGRDSDRDGGWGGHCEGRAARRAERRAAERLLLRIAVSALGILMTLRLSSASSCQIWHTLATPGTTW